METDNTEDQEDDMEIDNNESISKKEKTPKRINNFPDIKLKLFENSITIYL